MDAEKLLSDMLNNEFLVEMSKGLYESLGYDDTEWYRKSNDLTHEKVHCKEGVE